MSSFQFKKPDPQRTLCLCGCGQTCWSHFFKVHHGVPVMVRVVDTWYGGKCDNFIKRHGGKLGGGYPQVMKLASQHYGSIAQCGLTYLPLEKAPNNEAA